MPSAHAEVMIDAPIDIVWSVMTDVSAYTEWNPFIVAVDVLRAPTVQVGADLRLHVVFHGGRTARAVERVTRLDPPAAAEGVRRALLEYEFRGPIRAIGAVRGRRQQQLEQAPDAPTRYVTHERLRGFAARMAPIRAVQEGFERHAEALKARAEALALASSPEGPTAAS